MDQLVGSGCGKCQRKISSIVDGEFCHECGNPVHHACKAGSSDSTQCAVCGCVPDPVAKARLASSIAELPQVHSDEGRPASSPIRVNKLAFRLVVGGGGCVLFGGWWLVDALTDGFLDNVIGGLVWKGPLLMIAGAAAVYYGYRLMTDPGPTDPGGSDKP